MATNLARQRSPWHVKRAKGRQLAGPGTQALGHENHGFAAMQVAPTGGSVLFENHRGRDHRQFDSASGSIDGNHFAGGVDSVDSSRARAGSRRSHGELGARQDIDDVPGLQVGGSFAHYQLEAGAVGGVQGDLLSFYRQDHTGHLRRGGQALSQNAQGQYSRD